MSQDKLIQLSSKHNKKSNWLKDVIFRKTNRKWLDYSSQIARRILAKIDDDDLSQAELARMLDVSSQQVSKIVKGQENLSLQTIAKLSEALKVELISFPEYKYSVQENYAFIDSSIYSQIVSIRKEWTTETEKYYANLDESNVKSDNNFYVIKRSGATSKIEIKPQVA